MQFAVLSLSLTIAAAPTPDGYGFLEWGAELALAKTVLAGCRVEQNSLPVAPAAETLVTCEESGTIFQRGPQRHAAVITQYEFYSGLLESTYTTISPKGPPLLAFREYRALLVRSYGSPAEETKEPGKWCAHWGHHYKSTVVSLCWFGGLGEGSKTPPIALWHFSAVASLLDTAAQRRLERNRGTPVGGRR